MDITISANKKRFPILFVISLLFTVGGAYNINTGLSNASEKMSYLSYGILIIPLFFCIISFIEFMKTRFNTNAALTISEIGINDNLSIFSCGKICWSEISRVEIKRVLNTNLLVINLFDNYKYLKGKNFVTRYILRKWIKKWGSPIIISEKRINYDLPTLKDIILKNLTHIH